MQTNDTITPLLGATVQHGKLNDRVYLMNIGTAEPKPLIDAVSTLAKENGYTKIFAKVPRSKSEPFIQAGFQKEAEVDGFFNAADDALFLCTYFDDERRISTVQSQIDDVMKTATNAEPLHVDSSDVIIRKAGLDDIDAMAQLYGEVFPSYPFPIDEPDYLRETMETHVDYFLVEANGEIAALSSAEMDLDNCNVEMTDFATRPTHRGKRLAIYLLAHMEKAMKKKNIHCAYTIARAVSYPMNLTFARLGYNLGGVLTNNTNISGQIESMAVWHKRL